MFSEAINDKLPRRNLIITGVTLALFAGPIALDVLFGGIARVFHYFAADTFYYLTVARNFGRLGIFTFDQERVTNGFHPLWQVILGLLYRLGASDSAILILALALSVLLISGVLLLLARCFIVIDGKVPVWFTALPIGAYALVNVFFSRQYGTLWSFANGMESGLSLFFYAALLLLLVSPRFLRSLRSTLLAGMVLSLLVLSRLDNGFMIPALVIGIAVLYRDRLRAALVMCIPPAIVLGLYMLVNLATAGAPIPISGLLKSSGGLDINLRDLVGVIIYPSQPAALDRLWHHDQMWLPMIVAAAYLIPRLGRRARRRMQPLDSALWITALFVMALGAYNLTRVTIWDQGHWYYPISVLFVSLFVLRTVRGWQATPRLIAGITLAALAFFLVIYRNPIHNQEFANFWLTGGAALRRQFGDNLKIVEVDDGIVSFTTGYPALSGTGLMLDYEAAQHRTAGDLLALAYARGYTHLATLAYPSNMMNFFPDRTHYNFVKEFDQGYAEGSELLIFSFAPLPVETVSRPTCSTERSVC